MRLLILLSLCLLSTRIFSQQNEKNPCMLFPDLHFKGKTDTLTIKVILGGLAKPGPNYNIDKLSKERIVKSRRFTSQLCFYQEGCKTERFAPLQDYKGEDALFSQDNFLLTVRITCVVFKDYRYGNEPFFIVIKAATEDFIGQHHWLKDIRHFY